MDLPLEIFTHIALGLEVKDILDKRRVCREWRNAFDNRSFIETYWRLRCIVPYTMRTFATNALFRPGFTPERWYRFYNALVFAARMVVIKALNRDPTNTGVVTLLYLLHAFADEGQKRKAPTYLLWCACIRDNYELAHAIYWGYTMSLFETGGNYPYYNLLLRQRRHEELGNVLREEGHGLDPLLWPDVPPEYKTPTKSAFACVCYRAPHYRAEFVSLDAVRAMLATSDDTFPILKLVVPNATYPIRMRLELVQEFAPDERRIFLLLLVFLSTGTKVVLQDRRITSKIRKEFGKAGVSPNVAPFCVDSRFVALLNGVEQPSEEEVSALIGEFM